MNPIQNKIKALRGRLTRWILVRGIGQWLLIAIVVLLIDMGLDRIFKMDFAQRTVMLSLTAIGLSVLFFWKVLRPIWLRPSDEALVYEVEKKNPQLKESLLSAMQLDRQKSNPVELAGVSQQLVDVTIQKGFDDAAKVNFGSVLDLGQQRMNWLLFGVGFITSGNHRYWVRKSPVFENMVQTKCFADERSVAARNLFETSWGSRWKIAYSTRK